MYKTFHEWVPKYHATECQYEGHFFQMMRMWKGHSSWVKGSLPPLNNTQAGKRH